MPNENMTVVSFPGLGIGELNLNKVAFSFFGLEVRWYGILITIGIILAFLYAIYRGKKNENIIPDDVLDVGILTVICGVVGARLYYVLSKPELFHSFYDVIAIWNGGIAIYGAILGGCVGILIACAIKRLSWRQLTDMIAPGVLLAQAIGRWGNFINGEAHGYSIAQTTKFYFLEQKYILYSSEGSFYHWIRMGLRTSYGWIYCHPTFLYESVWNLCGFLLIHFFYRHKRFHGQIALMYLTWYGFGRMFVEGFRTDSLYLGNTSLRISQCLGLLCFALGSVLLIVLSIVFRHNHPAPAPDRIRRERVRKAPALAVASDDTAPKAAPAGEAKESSAFAKVMETVLQKQKKNNIGKEDQNNGSDH